MNALQRLGLRVSVAVIVSGGLWGFLSWGAPKEEETAETPEITYAPFSIDQVDALEIKSDSRTTRLEYRDKQWRLSTAQGGFLADEAQIKVWLERLSQMPLRPVVDPGPLELYGLARPQLSLQVYRQNALVAQLRLGERVLMEDSFYVSRAPLPGVFLVDATQIFPLQQDAERLRQRRLVPIDEEQITSVSLEGPTGNFELIKEGEHYTLRTEKGIDSVDQDAVDEWLATLTQSQVLTFASSVSSTPNILYKIRVQGGDTSVELVVSPEPDAWTKRTLLGPPSNREEDWVQLSAPSQLLLPTEESLRERRLFSFETSSVARFKLRWGDAFVVIGQGTEGWEFFAPRNGPLSITRVEALFSGLLRLRGAEIPSANPTEYGLVNPYGEVELFDSAGALLGRLAISALQEDGTAFAQATEKGQVVRLSVEELRRLALPVWMSGTD